MSTATFSRTGGLFTFRWEDPERIAAELAMLRVDRNGNTTAEVAVISTAPGASGTLHAARLNLSSTRDRADFARHLASRTPGTDVDWYRIVDTIAIRTTRAHREGDPAVPLADIVPVDEGTRFLLPPLILDRLPTIIFGDGGDLKSYLALAALLSIAQGTPEPLGIAPTRRVTGILADFEFDGSEHRARAERLVGSCIPPDVHYIRCSGSLAGSVQRLERAIRDTGAEFLVVDSVGLACDGPPEAAEVADRYFAALRDLGVPSLNLAHTNRSGDTDRPFGSTYWHNGARCTWYIKREATGAESVAVGLFNRKSNVGPLHAPLAFAFDFADGRTRVRRIDALDVPELAARVPLRTRLVHELHSGPRTYVELAALTGETVDTVSKAARRGETNGMFVRVTGPDGICRVALAERRREAV